MCFYEQFNFACGDWKWGNCVQQCQKEYRMGETCGMKLNGGNEIIATSCKTCEKIATKCRRLAAETERVNRWRAEPEYVRTASIEKSMTLIEDLRCEIATLDSQRNKSVMQPAMQPAVQPVVIY